MDKRRKYVDIVKRLFCSSRYLVHGNKGPGVETIFIGDDEHCRYLMMDIGWSGKDRVQSTILHVAVQDEKVWIEEDWTKDGIANELLRAGVPSEDIVLAFQHPSIRRYTDFASA